MEPYNKDLKKEEPKQRFDDRSGRIWGGSVLVAIGAAFLAHRAGVDIPHWLFSGGALITAIGIYVGARHSFRPGGWLIAVAVGVVFLADDIFYDFNMKAYLWPSIIIGIGLYMIFRPRKNRSSWGEASTVSSEDFVEAVSIFGGTKRNIISKDFRGGELTTFFGGTELNLMQADVTGSTVINITQAFGGTKLVVPAHWNIQSEVVCVFGGIDDKRQPMKDSTEPAKALILKGTCVFGGIDIKSY